MRHILTSVSIVALSFGVGCCACKDCPCQSTDPDAPYRGVPVETLVRMLRQATQDRDAEVMARCIVALGWEAKRETPELVKALDEARDSGVTVPSGIGFPAPPVPQWITVHGHPVMLPPPSIDMGILAVTVRGLVAERERVYRMFCVDSFSQTQPAD